MGTPEITLDMMRIEIQNVRDYDELVLDFSDSGMMSHITIIQMDNGTGKTTLHNLLRFLFSGESLTSSYISELKPTIFEADSGIISMVLRINEKVITITLELDYVDLTYQWYTTRASMNGGKMREHNLGSNTNFTHEFTRFFIFDGELAEEFLDSGKTTADDAIERLYGLSTIHDSSEMIKKNGMDCLKRVEETSLTTSKGINRMKSDIQKYQDIEESLKKEKNLLIKEKNEFKNKKKKEDESIEKLLSRDDRKELELIDSQIHDDSIALNQDADKIVSMCMNPKLFSGVVSKRIDFLCSNMEELRLPKSTSSEFFAELCQSDYCICGNKMTDSMRDCIRNNSEDYLSDDLFAVMNAVKMYVRELDDSSVDIGKMLENYHRAQIEMSSKEYRKMEIRRRINSIDLPGAVARYNSIVAECDLKIRECDDRLSIIDNENGTDPKECLKACRDYIERKMDVLSKAEPAFNHYRKAMKLVSILGDIEKTALSLLKKKIIAMTNDLLVPQFHGEIEIEGIDGSIKLKKKSGGSTGQDLTIAYIFLTSMFRNSFYSIPFIIDSPCGSLSKGNRKYTASILPDLFDHLVMFVTSSEKESFIEEMYNRDDVKYITIWKSHRDGKYSIQKSEDVDFFKEYEDNEE